MMQQTHTAVASDVDGVQWIPQDGEGSTVVVHHADSTHWYTLEQTESGQLTPAITQHKMMQHHVIVRGQSRHAYHSSIRHSLLFTHSRTSLNRKGREDWEGPPLTLSLCQSSCNSLYTCRNNIMLLHCMLDLSLHVSLKQGAPQWQISCTLYNLNLLAQVRGRRQAI